MGGGGFEWKVLMLAYMSSVLKDVLFIFHLRWELLGHQMRLVVKRVVGATREHAHGGPDQVKAHSVPHLGLLLKRRHSFAQHIELINLL